MKLRFVVAVAVAVVLAGGVATTQGQGRVEHFAIAEGPFDEIMVDCGDFLVWESYSVTFRGIRRMDAAGNPIQIVEHLSTYDAVYYNGNDRSIDVEAYGEHGLRRWDLADGLLYMSGPAVRLKIPNGPLVFLHTGHWIWDTTATPWELSFQKGRSDLFDNDIDALCRALRSS
jgi:hypothetical protein